MWYPKGTHFNITSFSNADYVGSQTDRKSTSGTCYFLGYSLVSWFSKKQNSVALSTTEVEYVSVGGCCAQILWMKQTLLDFGMSYNHVSIKYDKTSAINLSKNLILHSRAKYIDIRHYFLRDHMQKSDIILEFICTEKQLADIFNKPLSEDRFCMIHRELGIIDYNELH